MRTLRLDCGQQRRSATSGERDNTMSGAQPKPTTPDSKWEHYKLWEAVRSAIFALPSRFESDLVISGVLASDLFAFNSSLAATIEEQVVAALNRVRETWDPKNAYALYQFERQPQTFPDVILKAQNPNLEPQILMGIELKGWYVLAKEAEPSVRYTVSPAVCADADLLAVVPWALSRVVSGSPKVFTPLVMGARHAAEMRNYYWIEERKTAGNPKIVPSAVKEHYPKKSDQISDEAEDDKGGNFGRVARTSIMDTYTNEIMAERLLGIAIGEWQKFLKKFK